jgi:hypothetical protein
MADVGPVPDIDPVAMGRLRDADLGAIMATLNGPNPCWQDMNLPPALTCDGAGGTGP